MYLRCLVSQYIIYLDDKREYDKLAELQNNMNYQAKIVESYDLNTYTGEFNTKIFPITKEDKQMKHISKDFKDYEQSILDYDDYLKDLIKKYNIYCEKDIDIFSRI